MHQVDSSNGASPGIVTRLDVSFVVEDSQGNINPYAVTGCTLHGKDDLEHAAAWRAPTYNHCLIDTLGRTRAYIRSDPISVIR